MGILGDVFICWTRPSVDVSINDLDLMSPADPSSLPNSSATLQHGFLSREC